MLKINIQNQVRQTRLPKSKPLLPLFEAVTNSLQAIALRGGVAGKISIEIERGTVLPGFGEAPIQGIRIEDNGIGFTDENMDSFNTSYSDFKLRQGGKGIGRISWLVAFARAEIRSTFSAPEGLSRREFVFDLSYDPDKVTFAPAPGAEVGTTIFLRDYQEAYRKEAPTALADIAHDLCEHFLLMLVRPNATKIIVVDQDDPGGAIDLGEFFSEHFSDASEHPFQVGKQQLKLSGVRVKATHSSRHRLIFAADGRAVRKESFSRSIPNLPRPLIDDNDERFTYCGIVHGDYLDSRVNSGRTDFDLEDKQDDQRRLDGEEDIALDDIREGALEKVRLDLAPYLAEMRKTKHEAVAAYVRDEAPHYRVVLNEADTVIDALKPNPSKLDIDLALHAAVHRKEADLKRLGAKVILEADKLTDYDTYSAELNRFLEGENQVGLVALGKYVAHRKIIIDFLQRALSKAPTDDKYPLEKVVHNLVFPMRSTNGEILYSQQNLWLLDERLSFFTYISSDRPLSAAAPIESDAAQRPDIVLFDKRYVFAEGDRPVSSVVVVEFKRPMRDDYNKEDPIDQVLNVIKKVRESTFVDDNGRPLAIVGPDIPCFVYLICDLTPTLRERLASRDFTEHPDRQGFFNFHRGQRAYIEVISYDKLLADAKKRNRVLFDRLNFTT